jgi:hypothetical protein
MSVEKAFEINQQSSEGKITEELEDLQRGMVEINQILSSVKRCSVKEIILSEINLISAEIDKLKYQTAVNTNNVMLWSDVVARKKKASPILQNKPRQIPVITTAMTYFLSMKNVVEESTVQVQCNRLKVVAIITREIQTRI